MKSRMDLSIGRRMQQNPPPAPASGGHRRLPITVAVKLCGLCGKNTEMPQAFAAND